MTSKLVSDLGEFSLIETLTEESRLDLPRDVVGVGDDAAVLPATIEGEVRSWQLISVDSFVEGKHFLREQASAFQVGWKTVAAALSDIAAMGGEASGVLLSLHLPEDTAVDWLQEFYQGVYQCLSKFGLHLLGGDVVSSATLSFSATVLGQSAGRPVLRSGAKVGDEVWVSGELGGAAAGLAMLLGGSQAEPEALDQEQALRRLHQPLPQLPLGASLQPLASAMIDISDGFFQDLGHLLESSNLAAEIDLDAIPCVGSKSLALTGGEDYELLFTVPPRYHQEIKRLSEATVGQHKLPILSKVGELVPTADASPRIFCR